MWSINHFGPTATTSDERAAVLQCRAPWTTWAAAITFDGAHSRRSRLLRHTTRSTEIEEFHFDGCAWTDPRHRRRFPAHIVMEIAEAIRRRPGARAPRAPGAGERTQRGAPAGRGRIHATAQWNDDTPTPSHVLLTPSATATTRLRRAPRCTSAAPSPRASPTGQVCRSTEGNVPRRRARRALRARRSCSSCRTTTRWAPRAGRAAGGGLLARGARLAIATLLLAPASRSFSWRGVRCRDPRSLLLLRLPGRARHRGGRRRTREFASFALHGPGGARGDSGSERRDDLPVRQARLECLALDGTRGASSTTAAAGAPARARSRRASATRRARGRSSSAGDTGIAVDWHLGDGSRLHLRANFARLACGSRRPPRRVLHAEGEGPRGTVPAWSGVWTLREGVMDERSGSSRV
jgi:hypothetical protein